jgi:hypothetical protein
MSDHFKEFEEADARNEACVKTWPTWVIEAYRASVNAFWEGTEEDEYQYADTFRLARKGNEQEEADYETIRQFGCCGSVDTEFVLTNPDDSNEVVTVMWGFNYGH